MKTFVLMISKAFMKGHPRAGQPTHFREKILNKNGEHHLKDDRGLIYLAKITTIRENYPYWARIAEEVNAGRGVLSLRQWTKSPYNYQRDGSKQEEFLQLTKMGVQKITIKKILNVHISEGTPLSIGFDFSIFIDGKASKQVGDLPTNDGLTQSDFRSWFKKPLIKGAIIHFTDFRYK